MVTRAEQKVLTQRRILSAAQLCFTKNGITSSTIALVAKQAKVSTGSVMAHYPDKASLVAAAFEDELQQILNKAAQTLPHGDIVDRLVHPAEHLYAWYAQHPKNGQILVRSSLFLEGAWGARLQRQVITFITTQREHLAAAQEAGELPGVLPVELCAQGFFNDYFGTLLGLLSGFLPGPDAAVTQLRALTALRLGMG